MCFATARVAPEKTDSGPSCRWFPSRRFTGRTMQRKRKTISKKTRFEVFKRDSFKCQYCGESAPDVILEVDHIDPVSKGGEDEMVNYITACRSCNSGKSDRKLDDNTTLAKQRAQLEELNERREQLEMMMSWRSGMKEIEEIQVEKALDLFFELSSGWNLNEKGAKEATKLIKKYGLLAVLDAIETASESYIVFDNETGRATKDSAAKAWAKVAGILVMKNLSEAERELHYIKGILRNRLSYVPYDVMRDLTSAMQAGVDIQEMKLEAKHVRNWTAFKNWLHASEGL
jgi:hypothetical protein